MKHTVTFEGVVPALEQFILLAISNNGASMRSKAIRFKPSKSRYYVHLQDLRSGEIKEEQTYDLHKAIEIYNTFDEEMML